MCTFQLLTKQKYSRFETFATRHTMCYKSVAMFWWVVTTEGEVGGATWKHAALLRCHQINRYGRLSLELISY